MCAPEPAATEIPFPAVFPLDAVPKIASVFPLIPMAPAPAVKLTLLTEKSCPSVVFRFPALLAVKNTFVVSPGNCCVLAPAGASTQLVWLLPSSAVHVALWPPVQ